MKRLAMMVLVAGLLAGCQAEAPEKVCDCPEVKMEDLDFFGVYYSSCVQYITDLKEFYDLCGRPDIIPDVQTCVWATWNNSTNSGGCVIRLKEIAEVMALPDPCSMFRGGRSGTCEYTIRLE